MNLTLGVCEPSLDLLELGAVEEFEQSEGGTDPSLLLDEIEVEVEEEVAVEIQPKSSSDKRGEIGPGEVDLEDRQEINCFLEQIGFVHLKKDFSTSSISSAPMLLLLVVLLDRLRVD